MKKIYLILVFAVYAPFVHAQTSRQLLSDQFNCNLTTSEGFWEEGNIGEFKVEALNSRLIGATFLSYVQNQVSGDSSIYSYSGTRGGDLNSTQLKYDESIEFSYGNGQWPSYRKFAYIWDNSTDLPIERYKYNYSNGNWVDDERITFTHDIHGNVSLRQTYNYINNTYQLVSKETKNYSPSNQLVYENLELFSNNQPTYRMLIEQTYDVNGNRTSRTSTTWNNGQISNQVKFDYQHSLKGLLISEITNEFIQGNWVPKTRILRTYSDGKLTQLVNQDLNSSFKCNFSE